MIHQVTIGIKNLKIRSFCRIGYTKVIRDKMTHVPNQVHLEQILLIFFSGNKKNDIFSSSFRTFYICALNNTVPYIRSIFVHYISE